jgi:hypothetical protein
VILLRGWGNEVQTWECVQRIGLNALDRQALAAGVRLIAVAHRHLPSVWVDQSATTSVTLARGALGDEAYARAWADGEAMTLEQAVADALEPNGD